VQPVIFGMIFYNFYMYLWPRSLLKEVNKWIHNFIWFGDVSMKKLVTVYWEKVCHHAKEEGYGDQIA